MISRRSFLARATASLLAASAAPRVALATERLQVVGLVVQKADRELHLVGPAGQVLKTYEVELGLDPVGQKCRVGDCRTPEGTYRINRRNPQSNFHLSLGISYPNREDVARARALGAHPGGDIMLHGQPRGISGARRIGRDWTAGCIAVSNQEMEEIWRLVRTGTPISIYA